jgi:hypothetical protein
MKAITNTALRRDCAKCIFDKEAAERVRKCFWYDYNVGDNVDADPSLDGRNGLTEFCVLCAKLGVPIIRLREFGGVLRTENNNVTDRRGNILQLPVPCKGQEHLLVLRFHDGDHAKFPVLRRIRFRGVRYKLVGLYMGQRKCGHQIGMASPTGDWRVWSIADADLHKDGIGPMHIRFDGERWRREWWDAWKVLVHVTKFGRDTEEFCSLSPHNPPNDTLDKACSASTPRCGTNSIDMLYFPCFENSIKQT